MDKDTRNLLANTTQAVRRALEEEFRLQLEGTFDVHEDGRIEERPGAPLDDKQQLVRRKTISAIEHRRSMGESDADSVSGFLREAAFTLLNRLAALKMMEARGIVLECVSACGWRDGKQDTEAVFEARGFKEFSGLAPGLIELPDKGYRLYLECLFDEIGREVGVLFDRTDSASLLWPRRKALADVLTRINAPGLSGIWTEDETIGWIYQYYNDPEERAIMRDPKRGGSAAPRNSREMAVRNQFFTPRYVVEFLTDNTLGRLWYEMTKGKTRLKDQCRYLIRRPVEWFLPDPTTVFWHDSSSVGGFSRFCETASPHDLPTDPLLGELLGWVGHVKHLGFEEDLRVIGRNHQQIMDEILNPLEDGKRSKRLDSAHPVELMQVLWRLAYQLDKHGYGRPMETTSLDPVAGPVWNRLREQLQNPRLDISKEDQLKLPVFIPHRPLKDPRQIRMLDPACGSMHFGLYTFDLFLTIYEEAWQWGLMAKADFGFPKPPFPHHSVRMKPGVSRVHSNDLHEEIDAATARVVVLSQPDMGDGLWIRGPHLAPPDRHYRPKIAWEIPLKDFNYQQALTESRFTAEDGEQFVRQTQCWVHERAEGSTAEEIEQLFARQIPALIIENNIHGIDIDPRAAQMAGLAMWLRAQRAWQSMGLKPVDRPAIRKSNIVCAEPMPGEKELLTAFVTESFRASEQPFFQKLLDAVFEKMQIAGEAGALLQIEEEIRFLVHEAREAWKQLGKRSGELFSEAELARADQRTGTQLKLELGSWSLDSLSGIPDAEFWEQAEGRIYEALRSFAERAESSSGFQRRLFAEDAARGFAFIDLCRQRYDVALMNPPFGDASLPSKPYIEETYGDTKGDVYKAFVECFQTRLVPAGYLGIISSRTGFFLGQSEDWRTRIVLRLFRPIALADLGMGVLDAMVEVAAYVLRSLSVPEARDLTLSIVPVLEQVVLDKQERFSLPKWQVARGGLKRHQAIAELEHLETHGFVQRSAGDAIRYSPFWASVKKVSATPEPVYPPLVCVRALADEDKGKALLIGITGTSSGEIFTCDPATFDGVPGTPFAYWVSRSFLTVGKRFQPFEPTIGHVRVGVQTDNDPRFVRVWWEVDGRAIAPPSNDESSPRNGWVPFLKGDESSAFYFDHSLVLNWENSGIEVKAATADAPGGRINNEIDYFKPGISWALRTARFSPHVVPSGCIPSVSRYLALAYKTPNLAIIALWNSTVMDAVCKFRMERHGHPKFIVGVVKDTPFPPLQLETENQLETHAVRACAVKAALVSKDPTSHGFLFPALIIPGSTLADRAAVLDVRVRTSEETVAAIQTEIDDLAFRLYGLDAADRAALTSTLATEAPSDDETDVEAGEDEEEEAATDTATAPALAADLLAYALGCALGRWDIRYATGERPAPPAPDPFAPLPVCPPGMLQDDHGLPATPADVPTDYPLRITWPGILVDDPGHPEHDIGSRLQEVMERLFPERPDAIKQEACELLGVKSLRDWFRKPAGFFADHLKRYTKSKRKAPIYWPLSSPNGLYTIWIYYHRLNADTLFTAVRDFLEPKLKYEEQRAFHLKQEAGPTPSPSQRRDILEADDLVDDLRALKDELNRVAPLFRPNLNDGVILNCAPLWRMMSLPKWQTACKAAWDSLSKGDYDWAHLALHLWPERVIPKCAIDRSLAIAHGLEDTFWEITPEDELPKKQQGKGTIVWRPKKIPTSDLQTLITTHTSPAIKAALEELAKAPVAGGGKKGRKSAK